MASYPEDGLSTQPKSNGESWGPYRRHDGGVLRPGMSGGPHGLGDPDDLTLRRVEVEILIPKKMKERAKVEKCTEEVASFGKCAQLQGLMLPFKCRREAAAMKACLETVYTDEEFKNDCKQQYLQERSEYRRTGIGKKQKKKEGVLA